MINNHNGPIPIVHVSYGRLHHMLRNPFIIECTLFCFSLSIMLSYFSWLPIVFNSLMQMLLYQRISVLGHWLSSRTHSRRRCVVGINSAPTRCPYCYHSNKYLLTPSLLISLDRPGTAQK